jgi:Ni/Fe-hydrogenase subunit HybB-like protein
MEWLGFKRLRRLIHGLTILLTIFGVVLSTLHQSSLGALYLIAPSKLHPLWYSSYLPVYFFISSIIAGLSMVIFEGGLSHRHFSGLMDEAHHREKDDLTLGFGKAAALVLAGYFTIKVIGLSTADNWHLLGSGYGLWYLVELLGFVALPCFLYAVGVRDGNLTLIRRTAAWTVLGVVVNRFNISMVAFNWHLPAAERYVPHWMEVAISVFIVTLGILVFRFIVTRMPIFYAHPEYHDAH